MDNWNCFDLYIIFIEFIMNFFNPLLFYFDILSIICFLDMDYWLLFSSSCM
jgi:hypothetical protein